MQVWVNGGSASSSEVLAGALHDNCRASVVGSRSFGKGLIQGVFGLSDGGALVTTVASYATPNGREINLQGAASMLRESASWRRQSWPPTARGALFLPCAWQPAWPFFAKLRPLIGGRRVALRSLRGAAIDRWFRRVLTIQA